MTSLPLLLGVLAACALVGGVPSLVNALKPRLQTLLNLDAERVDRLERMQFFLAWVFGMPVAGYLTDHWQPHDILVAGCLGVAGTLAFFGITESARWVGAMSFLLGIATSLVAVSALLLVRDAVPGDCTGAKLNAAFIALGIGSFLPQFVLSQMERWLGLRRALLILGLAALIPIALIFAYLTNRPEPPQRDPVASTVSFIHDTRFWLVLAMLVLYYPIESALDIWGEPFLHEIGYQEGRARRMLVGFWIAFLLGRLAMWYLLGPNDEIWLLFFCALISAIVLGNLVGAYGASAGGIGFWLVGACYGPLLPGFLGMVLDDCPNSPGLALGTVLGIAGLHDALAHPLMRRGTQTRSVRVAMRVPLIMTLLMLAPLVILGVVKWPAP
jgi:fucose permease